MRGIMKKKSWYLDKINVGEMFVKRRNIEINIEISQYNKYYIII